MTDAPVPASAPRSLADDLRARSDEALAALLRERPDLARPVPADLGRLAERASTRASVARVMDRLDRWALQVVEAVAVAPEGSTPEALAALLGADPADVAPQLERLRDLGLLWGEPGRLVRTTVELLGAAPAGLGPPAVALLLAQSPARLDALGGLLAAPATAEGLALAYADPRRLDALLEDAGPAAREALAAMAWGPPSGRLPDALREVSPATARTPVEALLARGLLLPVAADTVALPREVALHLRGGRLVRTAQVDPPPLAASAKDPARVGSAAAGTAAEVVRRVERLLDAWAAQPAVPLRAGGLGVRELRRATLATELDEPGAALLVELVAAAGLAGSGSGDDQGWLPTPAYDAWRRDDPAEQWAAIAATWLALPRTPGGAAGAPLGPDLDRPALPALRRDVLELLARAADTAGAGAAPSPESLLATLAWHRPRRASRALHAAVRAVLDEATALGVTGLGALAGPGRALLDPSDPRRAAADALAPLLPRPLDSVLLQADLTAVAPGPLVPDLRRELALVAEVESTGGATVFRFTAASVRRALDAGRSADDVLDLLHRASRTPVPQPLAYLVQDVARRHGHLRVGAAASVVRSDDPAALDELLVDPRAAGLGLRRLAPTVLAAQVLPETLLDRLRELGGSPVAEAGDGTLLLGAPAPRRAPARLAAAPLPRSPRSPESAGDRPDLPADLAEAAVRALRAGDRALGTRPDAVDGGPAETLERLRDAAGAGASVWIGYADRDGAVAGRVVEPIAVAGGVLTAYDARAGAVRSFALHRISGVAAPRDRSA